MNLLRGTPAHACSCGISRRGFLAGGAALFAATAIPAGDAAAQASAPTPAPFRIDVHHHLTPPDYITAVNPRIPLSPLSSGWTVQKSLADMDKAGVQTAMLSITTPGLWFGDATASAKLSRGCNEYAARLIADNPGRFGSFASLPMLNADAALGEINYAFDTLKADGVCVFTSYEGKWLGDAVFMPIFDELNRRKAVVSVHPTTAACCGNLMPFIPDTVIEFGTDTTRTIASLVFSGAVDRWPDIRFVFSHAGGTMPFLIERFEFLARSPSAARMVPDGVRTALSKLYYDTAQASNPAAMGALRQLVDVSQIVFGTDFPYRTGFEHVNNLAGCGFSAPEMLQIERENALAILPRLRA